MSRKLSTASLVSFVTAIGQLRYPPAGNTIFLTRNCIARGVGKPMLTLQMTTSDNGLERVYFPDLHDSFYYRGSDRAGSLL
jgi:hypothetical protein